MSDFDVYMEKATAPGPNRVIPGCVLAVATKDGLIYEKSFGTQSVDPNSPLYNKPLSLDTTMWIASCTKLMTAISALQCVERGLLNLDEPVGSILHEYKDPEILTGFEEGTGKPIYERAKEPVTLRRLLTHSSGLGYKQMNPIYVQWAKYKNEPPTEGGPTFNDMCLLPLLFEPGTKWQYGVGVDWAGQMVERVNGSISLGDYMEKHIWTPLGMKSTTFRLQSRPDILSRRADMTIRPPGTTTLQPSPTRLWPEHLPDDHGGAGCYSTVGDYIKVLQSLIANDGKLLKPETVDLLMTPCLTAASKAAYNELLFTPQPGVDINIVLSGNLHRNSDFDYALGGMVVRNDVRGSADGGDGRRRSKGSMAWGGLPNLHWVVDRKAGVAFMYGEQLLPNGDRISAEVFRRFEEAIYAGEVAKGAVEKL